MEKENGLQELYIKKIIYIIFLSIETITEIFKTKGTYKMNEHVHSLINDQNIDRVYFYSVKYDNLLEKNELIDVDLFLYAFKTFIEYTDSLFAAKTENSTKIFLKNQSIAEQFKMVCKTNTKDSFISFLLPRVIYTIKDLKKDEFNISVYDENESDNKYFIKTENIKIWPKYMFVEFNSICEKNVDANIDIIKDELEINLGFTKFKVKGFVLMKLDGYKIKYIEIKDLNLSTIKKDSNENFIEFQDRIMKNNFGNSILLIEQIF